MHLGGRRNPLCYAAFYIARLLACSCSLASSCTRLLARLGLLLLVCAASVSAASPKALPAPTSLPTPAPVERTCRPLPNSSVTSFAEVDPAVNKLIAAILVAIKKEDNKALHALLHPRLQRHGTNFGAFFTRLRFIYRAPWTVNVTRLWELRPAQSVDELHCVADTLYLKPMYGHALQYFLWLSVVGKQELGRIVVPLVEYRGKWLIGALHTRQWTHLGLDFNDWLGKAMQAQSTPMLAWALFDITQKLLQDSPFMRFPQRIALHKAQQQIMPTAQWQQKILKIASQHEVIFVNSILTPDGIGILLRLHIAKALSGRDIDRTCRDLLANFKQQQWFKGLRGIKCSFVIKGEPTDREGALGGIYVPS